MSTLLENELKEELRQVAQECSAANWDGYGALPVQRETFEMAGRVIEGLPNDLSAPSVGAEADGQLTLEWYRAPRWTVSVSVGPEGKLHYAALLGEEKASGTESSPDEFPRVISALVRKVCAG